MIPIKQSSKQAKLMYDISGQNSYYFRGICPPGEWGIILWCWSLPLLVLVCFIISHCFSLTTHTFVTSLFIHSSLTNPFGSQLFRAEISLIEHCPSPPYPSLRPSQLPLKSPLSPRSYFALFFAPCVSFVVA